MSHFLTGVIVEDGGRPLEDLLAPYDENTEVAPYRKYIKGDDLQRMKKHYHVTTIARAVEHIKDWTGCDGGFDKDGLYYLSTYNPSSQWDWYDETGGRWADSVPNEDFVTRKHLDNFFAIVTPDGVWHERGDMGWFGMVSDQKPEAEWNAEKAEIAKRYKDFTIISVDCHI